MAKVSKLMSPEEVRNAEIAEFVKENAIKVFSYTDFEVNKKQQTAQFNVFRNASAEEHKAAVAAFLASYNEPVVGGTDAPEVTNG